MSKKLFKNLLSLCPALLLPTVAVSCGGVKIDSKEKIDQDKKLSKIRDEVSKQYVQSILASLYGINVSDANKLTIYQESFKNKNSQLYKDSLKAFRLYESDKKTANSHYFEEKINEWAKANIFTSQELAAFGDVRATQPLTEEQFILLWLKDKTQIRNEIEKMLLVHKYFEIGNRKLDDDKEKNLKKNVEELKKLDKDFKYDKNLKYELEYYTIIKYALEKKLVQQWEFDGSTDVKHPFFITPHATITGINSFNDFFIKKGIKGNAKTKKIVSDFELLREKATSETQNEKQPDQWLDGYKGFKTGFTSYNLSWDYENLKNKEANRLYGYYDANNNRIINLDFISADTFKIEPYKRGENSDKPIVAYINQIAPIGAAKEVELPNSEDAKKDEKTKVKLLTFNGTFFRDKLDLISFIFYLKDGSLYDKAINSYAKLGFKIKINIDNDIVKEALKDLVFVEKEEKKDGKDNKDGKDKKDKDSKQK
ncbi:HinT-interacting membrane complex lipoprotein P60 [Mycoplasmopsis opalescens]|uniref:HinT-interacting membrane complex lipoprotein P60 n=1 Tax=Mycoplasmopsis opalescens TaxID=114886 RepID=UPI00068CEA71|nr:hypothetical protein [Mycoplasmopsis opalescens]